jgi:hypothetical protein
MTHREMFQQLRKATSRVLGSMLHIVTQHHTRQDPKYTIIHQNTGHTQRNGAVLKTDKNLFLILDVHNIHCQQRELSKFLMSYQQFTPHT